MDGGKAPVGTEVQTGDVYSQLGHADFAYALREIGSYVDISEDDLAKIYRLAVKHAWQLSDQPEKITAGLYYSDGDYGADGTVRKVIALSGDGKSEHVAVTFKIVDGEEQGSIKTVALVDFANWQSYEVILKDGFWHRISHI